MQAAENSIRAENVNIALNNNIKEIERKLEIEGTSVDIELSEAINMLELDKERATDEKEIEKLQALIDETVRLKNDYSMYSTNVSTSGISVRGVYNPVYSPAVAAVASYFMASGYLLSYELLIHARDNNRLDSTYVPVYGNRIKSSAVVGRILSNKKDISGSAAFENTGGTVERDLYYAIHNFNYSLTAKTKTITLTDRYDYASQGEYTGVAGVAIETMYIAQNMHVIVPYYVVITV